MNRRQLITGALGALAAKLAGVTLPKREALPRWRVVLLMAYPPTNAKLWAPYVIRHHRMPLGQVPSPTAVSYGPVWDWKPILSAIAGPSSAPDVLRAPEAQDCAERASQMPYTQRQRQRTQLGAASANGSVARITAKETTKATT